MDHQQKPSWLPKVLILFSVLIAGGLVAYFQKTKTEEPPELSVTDVKVTKKDEVTDTEEIGDIQKAGEISEEKKEVDSQESVSEYKDGKYSVTGAYTSPGGPETIAVTLTVTDDVVTDALVVPQAVNPASKKWQSTFAEGYKLLVVGKKLSDLSLTVVSGSSLTPKGFNDAVAKIRVQAQS